MPGLPRENPWQPQVLRLTVFPAQPLAEPSNQEWWAAVAGEKPENRKTLAKGATQQDEGVFGDGNLTLKVQPDRIDWLHASSVGEEEDQVPSLGRFDASCERLLGALTPWISECPPAARIAFGAILVQPVENRSQGYQLLNRYLRFLELDEGARDFLFRINRRRASAVVEGLLINRISNWSVLRFVAIQASVSGDKVDRQLLQFQRYAGRLELDINSDVDFGSELPHEQLARLLNELVQLGNEIAVEGDVK